MWSSVKEHIYTLLMGAAACDHHFLVERSVVGLLRLAIRLMHKEEMGPVVIFYFYLICYYVLLLIVSELKIKTQASLHRD